MKTKLKLGLMSLLTITTMSSLSANTTSDKTTTDLNTTKVEKSEQKPINLGICYGCHGKHFERSALGKSKKVSELKEEDISKALQGYKKGNYGGPMKGIMIGQVKRFSDDEVKQIAKQIYLLNHKKSVNKKSKKTK